MSAVPEMWSHDWCTMIPVPETKLPWMLSQGLLYNKCCLRDCCIISDLMSAVLGTAIPWMLYHECCPMSGIPGIGVSWVLYHKCCLRDCCIMIAFQGAAVSQVLSKGPLYHECSHRAGLLYHNNRHLILHFRKRQIDCKFRERVELAVSSEKESNWLSIQRKSQITS